MPRFLSRALLAALLLTAVSPRAHAKASAPAADKDGVWQVFGEGKKPPVHVPVNISDAGEWEKKGSKLKDGTEFNVIMAWDDAGIAKAQGRVFENANPYTLKNNVYTWILLESGNVSFGNPVDQWEVGTRHAHLAHGRPVIASGELVKSNSGLRINMLSGTYMIPMVNDGKIDPAKMGARIKTWFDEVLRKKFSPPALFKVEFSQHGKGTYQNDKIFEVDRAKDMPRLPYPTLCSIQKETHLCDKKFKFAGRNGALCKKALAAKC